MYSNAQWVDYMGQHQSIRVDINGVTSFVPLDPANTDYENIMKLVDEGKLVIQPAEEPLVV
jgi:hypothetical protein